MPVVRAIRQIQFIADDFGLGPRVNGAILHAHREGVLTGASLMLGQSGSDEAVRIAAATPGLEVGWHLHVCDSRPVTCPRWPWGGSPFAAAVLLAIFPSARRRVRDELVAQWQLLGRTGVRCRFINAHHHLHLHPVVGRIVADLVGHSTEVWIRGGRFHRFGTREGVVPRLTRLLGNLHGSFGAPPQGLRTPDSVWGVDRLHAMNADEVVQVVGTLSSGFHEFIFHPGGVAEGNPDPDLEALIRLRTLMGFC